MDVQFGSSHHDGTGDINQAGRDLIQYINTSSNGQLPIPRQLPSGAKGFVNRVNQLTQLDTLLEAADDGRAKAVFVVGTAGVGKTALALEWAHTARRTYADGDLYINLRGYDAGGPADPAEVLDGFLRAFDIPPEKVPPSRDAREGMYRAVLSSRQVLIVLDNAATADQIRPLLPGAGRCAVLITSRRWLPGLSIQNGVEKLDLERLPPGEAVNLLTTLIGKSATDDPASAVEIARLCACLPLALRIVAERARSRHGVLLRDIADDLRTWGQLEMLSDEDDELSSVRAVFSWSVQGMPPAAARMFKLLGLHPGPDITTAAAAALADSTTAEAGQLLKVLLRDHMVESPERERYQLHDLLRVYAAERARADIPSQELDGALSRELTWYLYSADNADLLLNPHRRRIVSEPLVAVWRPRPFTTRNEAVQWCEAERMNAVALIRQADHAGMNDIVWKIPLALNSFFYQRWYIADWMETALIGAAAARQLDDVFAQAWSVTALGGAYEMGPDWSKAIECYEDALQLWRECADLEGEMMGLSNLGNAYREVGRLDEASDLASSCLNLAVQLGDRRYEATALKELGQIHEAQNNFAEAVRYLERAVTLHHETEDKHTEGQTLHWLANAYHSLGSPTQAFETYRQALYVQRDIRDQRNEAATLMDLGIAELAAGHTPEAAAAWRQAKDLFTTINEPVLADRADTVLREAGLIQMDDLAQ